DHNREDTYWRILNKGNVRPLDPQWWRAAVELVEAVFAAANWHITSFPEMETALTLRLEAAGLAADPMLIHKVRTNLFALHQFVPLGVGKGIDLRLAEMGEAPTLLGRVDEEIVRRLVSYATPPINSAAVAAVLYGSADPTQIQAVDALIQSIAGAGQTTKPPAASERSFASMNPLMPPRADSLFLRSTHITTPLPELPNDL
ncbi:MAG: hypothetical protein M3Z04_06845, partial [Chloroflexota bacterium]|nr:hypothetical protein [Chloroflexota bacterium]